MRVYLKSFELAAALRDSLSKKGITQDALAKQLDTTQGAVSHILNGNFKTQSSLVRSICEYVKIRVEDYRLGGIEVPSDLEREAQEALAKACGGKAQKTKAVIRVLQALHDLSPAN